MKKKSISAFASAFFLIITICSAQQGSHNKRIDAIEATISAYNQQDYPGMKKHMDFIGKHLITKKALKKEFGNTFTYFGKATIDTVTYVSEYDYTVKLIFEKSIHKRVYLKFLFNNQSQINGLGFTYPPLIYPENKTSAMMSQESANRKAFQMDSLIKKNDIKSKWKGFNGCVLALDNGKVIYKNCFGYANLSTKSLLNDSSLFELASCSKQFTAMAIMMLAEQGKLLYTDSIQTYIPDFPYHQITIENLLTHTSGLPDYESLMKKHWDKAIFATNNDLVPFLVKYKAKPLFKPNEQFMYSNTGYALLSLIIEKASGLSYEDCLKQYIFFPLGMRHTRVYNTRRSKHEIIPNYAYGYVGPDDLKKTQIKDSIPLILPDNTSEYQEVIYQDAITGDGTVNSTITDLILWDKALREYTLVKKVTLDKAYSEHTLTNGTATHYGYGQFLHNGIGMEPLVYHTGSWPGYYSIIMRFTEIGKTLVVLSNTSYENFSILADNLAAVLIE